MSIKKIVQALRPLQQVTVVIAGHPHVAADPLTGSQRDPHRHRHRMANTLNWHDSGDVAVVGRAHRDIRPAGQVFAYGFNGGCEVFRWRGHGAQGPAHGLSEPQGTPKSKVEPLPVQGGEDGELLGHHQRAVIGQHDSAGTHPDRASGRRNRLREQRWRAGGDPRDPVML